jgi:acyl dehydratase
MSEEATLSAVEGPFFEDLEVGMVFDTAPGMTLNEGAAAIHQAITGNRLRLAMDRDLSEQVLGAGRWFADPSYVWDVAIGQSTEATQNVTANLFYRGLAFQRTPVLGDTLRTVTTVVGLRANRDRPDRAPTGLAALRITTSDQQGRGVLDFWRCAMLPRRAHAIAGRSRQDDLTAIGEGVSADPELVNDWRWSALSRGPRAAVHPQQGSSYEVRGGDVVSSAPELARLTTNLAAVHHDSSRAGARLVYGGHTVGIALAQATRALPGLLTVTAWHSCDHLGPVREGDTLRSTVTVESVAPVNGDIVQVTLRSLVAATAAPDAVARPVLDWRFVALST